MFVLLAAVTVACSLGGPLDAAKPPKGDDPPPPPPLLPGTITFRYEDDLWAMSPDGGNQGRIATPDFLGAPSSRVYGNDGHRWSLFAASDGRTYDRAIDEFGNVVATNIAHRELMAACFDADGALVEITPVADSYGAAIYRISGGFDEFPSNQVQLPAWSNDTQDSFVSWYGSDISAAFTIEADGTTIIDVPNVGIDRLIKIEITGAEIDAGVVAGPARIHGIRSGGWAPNFHWHPSGTFFARDTRRTDPETGWTEWDIQMHDGATGNVLWKRTSNVQWGAMVWSPVEVDPDTHAALLMFIEDNQLKIMPADPTGFDPAVTIFTPSGKNGAMWNPIWSPDGSHVFIQHLARSGRFGGEYQSLRMSVAGGQQFNLAGNLDARWLRPLYWLTNDPPAN
jgi:hypothetical protein